MQLRRPVIAALVVLAACTAVAAVVDRLLLDPVRLLTSYERYAAASPADRRAAAETAVLLPGPAHHDACLELQRAGEGVAALPFRIGARRHDDASCHCRLALGQDR